MYFLSLFFLVRRPCYYCLLTPRKKKGVFLGRDGSERIASVWNNDKQSDKIRILREYLGKKRSDTLDSITIDSFYE